MRDMRHLDLFSGIGGFTIAAETVWGGEYENVGFCDNDPFCQAILHKHWPDAKIYGDVRKFHPEGAVDILTGGFPCQPFSHAGKRKGTDDDRHLWPEMLRIIREASPRWVVGENVRGLLSIEGGLVFESVCADLEAIGYEVQPFVIPACAVDAPHRRDRVWIVGYADGPLQRARRKDEKGTCPEPGGSDSHAAYPEEFGWGEGDTDRGRIPKGKRTLGTEERRRLTDPCGDGWWNENWPSAATRLCALDDGLPDGLARPHGWRNAALKAAGNAIVPQVAMEIFSAIKQTEKARLNSRARTLPAPGFPASGTTRGPGLRPG